jgi:hypothetical protein
VRKLVAIVFVGGWLLGIVSASIVQIAPRVLYEHADRDAAAMKSSASTLDTRQRHACSGGSTV